MPFAVRMASVPDLVRMEKSGGGATITVGYKITRLHRSENLCSQAVDLHFHVRLPTREKGEPHTFRLCETNFNYRLMALSILVCNDMDKSISNIAID